MPRIFLVPVFDVQKFYAQAPRRRSALPGSQGGGGQPARPSASGDMHAQRQSCPAAVRVSLCKIKEGQKHFF